MPLNGLWMRDSRDSALHPFPRMPAKYSFLVHCEPHTI